VTSQYAIKVIAPFRVPMRDGVELNVRITRPDADGRFPAVMEYSPYRNLGPPPPLDASALVPFLAQRGYVLVQFEVRGTGSSAGFTTDIYSPEERQDGYDMIEWIAAQPWCTGSVGMMGLSYGAVVQWQVAVQQPPHLKAIIVRSGNDDVYTEFTNPGGCIRPWMFEAYAPHMNASNFCPPSAQLVGSKWADIWTERLEKSEPWSLGYIRNLLDGPYWQSRSLSAGYERVKCPVFLIEGWADWYATAELRAFQKLSSPKKVLIGPWGHYYPENAFPGPRIDGRREFLKWFDHWLKGIDNGVMDEPPVTVFVRRWKNPELIYLQDEGSWRNETAWPPEHVKQTAFYLGAGGRLTNASDSQTAGDAYEYRPSVGLTTGRRSGMGSTAPWGLPGDQRLDEAYSLLYTTEPLREPMVLLGEPAAILRISSTAQTAYFHVKLCDVAPDGVSKLITDGGLLATHRHSHEKPEPLVPGQVYELRFPLKHTAYAIDPGHRLRIAITSADFQNAWPTGQPAVNTIHRGGPEASRVLLPVAAVGAALSPPQFADSPNPLPALAAVPKPEVALHFDLVNDSVTSELAPPPPPLSGRIHRSRFTVYNRDPARAAIDSSFTINAGNPALDIQVSAACQTVSDQACYTHSSQVEITVNGRPYFQKSWSQSVPRNWS
jgi:predicted acyl esterase